MKAKKKRAVATEVYRTGEPRYDACGTYLGDYLTKTDDQIPIPLALRLVSYAKTRLAATGLSLGKGWRCVVGTADASGDWDDRSYCVDWRNLKTGFCVAVTGILVKEGAPVLDHGFSVEEEAEL